MIAMKGGPRRPKKCLKDLLTMKGFHTSVCGHWAGPVEESVVSVDSKQRWTAEGGGGDDWITNIQILKRRSLASNDLLFFTIIQH